MTERRIILAALVAVALAAVAVALLPRALALPWLAALFFWSGVPVGSIGFALMMRLIGGGWRSLEPAMAHGAASLSAPAIAILPILLALTAVYPWAAMPLAGFKGAWLAPLPFALRTIVWLGGLAGIVLLLPRAGPRMPVLATVGLIFLVPMGSLIAVDWLMSLDPGFHSSGFGLQALAIQFTVALMVAVLRAPPDRSGTTGALMLTVLMLWGYFAYLPFFILWSGNAPAAAAWYLARGSGGWGWVATLAAAGHAAPLLALFAPRVRRSPRWLAGLALAVLVADALQAAWLVLPQAGSVGVATAALYLAALLAIGGATLLTPVRR